MCGLGAGVRGPRQGTSHVQTNRTLSIDSQHRSAHTQGPRFRGRSGPGNTRKRSVFLSLGILKLDDLIMDPENGFYRSCYCCPAEPCHGQIDNDSDKHLLVLVRYVIIVVALLSLIIFLVGLSDSPCRRLVPHLRSQPRLCIPRGVYRDGMAPGVPSGDVSPFRELMIVFTSVGKFPFD